MWPDMKALIALALVLVAALFATGIEEVAMDDRAGGWLALIVFASVFVLVLHRLQKQARRAWH